MAFRDIKNKARRDLHDAMKVPANFYSDGEPTGTPVTVNVRVHTDVNENEQQIDAVRLASPVENSGRLVFDLLEATPVRQGVVSVETDEAYEIDYIEPVDGITQTAVVSRLKPEKAAKFTPPSG